MQTRTITNANGRKQQAHVDGEMIIPIGPPLDLVDSLNLPEPFATNLHNALHARGLFNYAAVARNGAALSGALQEVLLIDVQVLTEAFFRYENPPGGQNAR